MKKINPLYLALFFVVALAVVVLRLDRAETARKEAAATLQETETTAKRIVALQGEWEDKKATLAALERILRSAPLRDRELNRRSKSGRVILDAAALDKRAADYLLNKLLNGSFVIKSLTVRRLDPEHAAVQAEVLL